MAALSTNENSYKIDKCNITPSIEFAKYNRDSMASRRGVGLKVFPGVMVLYFFILFEGLEVLDHTVLESDQLNATIQWFYIIIAVIFTIFIIQIEIRNDGDSKRYDLLTDAIDAFLKNEQPPNVVERRFWRRTPKLWAAVHPVSVTWGVAVLGAIYFGARA